MKRFQSSLQALGILRERQEQLALQHYGSALRSQEEARRAAEAVQREIESNWDQMRRQIQIVGSALELSRLERYGQALELRRAAAERAVSAAQRQTRLAFARLLAARRAKAVVEKYSEKQKRHYDRSRQRHDQHVLDEMVHHLSGLAASAEAAPQFSTSPYE